MMTRSDGDRGHAASQRLWRHLGIVATAMLLLIAPVRLQAQGEVFDVTYLEVAPSSKSSAVVQLKHYSDGSRTEPGNMGLELLEQVGRPGHFVILESWRDQPTLDRHQAQPTTSGFLDALQTLRVSA